MRFLAGVLAFAVMASSARAQVGAPQTPPPREKIVVGVPTPNTVRGTVLIVKGEIGGYAPTLIREAAKEVGLELEFYELPFHTDPMPSLRSGKIDLFGPLGVIEPYVGHVSFSDPILTVRGAAYSLADAKPVSVADDLRGARLVAAASGIGHKWCVDNGLPCEAARTLKEALQLVRDGRADYVITPMNAGRWEIEALHFEDFVEHQLQDRTISRTYSFIALPENEDLIKTLDRGIDRLRDDGRYDEIYAKWMEHYQPARAPMSRSLRTALWVLGVAGAMVIFIGLWQVMLRRELSRRTYALRESETKYRAIFEHSHDAILLLELGEGRVLDANDRACELFGQPREALIDSSFLRIEPNVLSEPTAELARYERPDTSLVWIEIGTSRAQFGGDTVLLVIVRDVSERIRAEEERQRLEAQLFQAQKLEGLGLLAGGIAHDFNNLLVGVTGNVDLALYTLEEPERARARLEDALKATQRAAELTHQLLAYSGRAHFSEELVDVSAVVAEMVQLLGSSLSEHARLDLALQKDLPKVLADPTLIRQVLMNLLTNARDALETRGHKLIVRTGTMLCDRELLANTHVPSDIEPGEYVFVELEDDGCGMDEATLQRIFDPFFSTKFTGRGLGLSVVLKTMQRHKGAVKVHSTPGRGTCFRLLLPFASIDGEVGGPRAVTLPSALSGHALVVDDEPMVRDVARRVLEPRGWIVSVAPDGGVALDMIASAPGVDVVLLDVTMPGQNGHDVLRSLRRTHPVLPVVMMSGYSEEVASVGEDSLQPDAFLRKPFTGKSLAQALDAALAKKRARSAVV